MTLRQVILTCGALITAVVAASAAAEGLALLDVDYATGRVTAVHIVKSTGYPKIDAEAQQRFMKWHIKPRTTHHVKVPVTVAITGEKY